MLDINKGQDTGYLTKEIAGGRESYYSGAVAAGEPPGRWYGSGAAALGLNGEVDNELLEGVYSRVLDPRDPRSRDKATWGEADTLGKPWRHFRSAEELYAAALVERPHATPEERNQMRVDAENAARQAVMFEDATFSPVKSVSVAGVAFERAANDAAARGDHEAAAYWGERHRAVEEAVLAGASAGIDYLEEQAGYGHVGSAASGGLRWVDTNGLTVAQFLQHDSRVHDPQLHVHQAILNKIQLEDGSWKALDGRLLRNHKHGAGAMATRVMEAHLADRLGLRFVDRQDGKGREVVGVDQETMDLFSGRRLDVTEKLEELKQAYRDEFGHEPSPVVLYRMGQQATLATRPAKTHDGETREEMVRRWDEQVRGEVGQGLAGVANSVTATEPGEQDRFTPDAVIERALAQLGENGRQSWNRSDLLRAVSDALPANLKMSPDATKHLLSSLTDVAVERATKLSPEQTDAHVLPDEFVRKDGTSQFTPPGTARYTHEGTWSQEQYLREQAATLGAARMSPDAVQALIDRYAENGKELKADQRAALQGILTSGAQIETVTAPAGAGKTFLLGVLADGYTEGRVIGLAPSQTAAGLLAEEGLQSANTAAWLMGRDDLQARAGDVVVVDEASMADTNQIRQIEERCRQVGAKMLLVGDPKQLSAVGPGGMLADLGARAKHHELTEVRRFHEDWEKKASLALRDGDPDAIKDYDKHGRLVAGGTTEQAEEKARRAWLADTLANKKSLLLTGSNEQAARVSASVREELVRLGRVSEDGVPLGLQGTMAGRGDVVEGRLNGWDLKGWEGNTHAPLNRDSYRVMGVREDGGLTVRRADDRDGTGPLFQLSKDYVTNHLALGYASTDHSAQGRTVDTAHSLTGSYVGMTRGAERNTAWLTTRTVAPQSEPGEAQAIKEMSPRQVLEQRLRMQREDELSAMAEREKLHEDYRSTTRHAGELIAGVEKARAGHTSRLFDDLATQGVITESDRTRLAADDGSRALDRLLRVAELSGHDPAALVRDATAGRDLSDARSVAQVLHHRITTANEGRLTPKIQGGRDLIPGHAGERDRAFLEHHADGIDARRAELGKQLAEKPPAWATERLGDVPEEPSQRTVWEHKAGWAGAWRELSGHDGDGQNPLGPAPPNGLPERAAIFRAAHTALDLPDAGADEASMSDGQLRNRVAAYEREEGWAPRFVADDLSEANQAREAARANATIWETRAKVLQDQREQQRLLVAAREEQRKAEAEQARVEQLQAVDEARAKWVLNTLKTRDYAERARVELGNRGVDLVEEPQVTGEEWLEQHRAEQEAREAEREMAADDVRDDDHDELDQAAANIPADPMTPSPEVDVPDIRETATEDVSEHEAKPEPVAEDEVEPAVDRAAQAEAEIRNREADEAARAADEAAERERDAEEQQPEPVQDEPVQDEPVQDEPVQDEPVQDDEYDSHLDAWAEDEHDQESDSDAEVHSA